MDTPTAAGGIREGVLQKVPAKQRLEGPAGVGKGQECSKQNEQHLQRLAGRKSTSGATVCSSVRMKYRVMGAGGQGWPEMGPKGKVGATSERHEDRGPSPFRARGHPRQSGEAFGPLPRITSLNA